MSTKPLKVLLVEDEPGRAREARRQIERIGDHSIAEAVYGSGLTAALATMERDPDLIVLDLVAPAGHVLLTTESLRYQPALRETPIVVMGESKRWLDRVDKLGLPRVYTLKRPVEPEEFDAVVRQTATS